MTDTFRDNCFLTGETAKNQKKKAKKKKKRNGRKQKPTKHEKRYFSFGKCVVDQKQISFFVLPRYRKAQTMSCKYQSTQDDYSETLSSNSVLHWSNPELTFKQLAILMT